MNRELNTQVAQLLHDDVCICKDPGDLVARGAYLVCWRCGKSFALPYTADSRWAYKMEKALSESERPDYLSALCIECQVGDELLYYDGVEWASYEGVWALVHATPEQRCRAFVKVRAPCQQSST